MQPTEVLYPPEFDTDQYQSTDIIGFPFFQTVTAVPTITPTSFLNQIIIVNSPPGTYQLYIYEPVSAAWKAVLLA